VERGRVELRMRVRPVPEPERGIAAPDEGAHLRAEPRAEPQIDARVTVAEAPEPRGECRAREGPDERQRHGPAVPRAQRGDGVGRVAHGGEERLGVRQEEPPGLGENDPAPDPLEQRRAELRLEQPDPAADGRLGEAERRRGAREAALSHDRHERLDVVELHGRSA
jgi:hypothetical protein